MLAAQCTRYHPKMQDFTALHRVLGQPPGPVTDDMLDEAVATGAAETDDLDWKRALPPEADLARSDTVKDIAAMANSGGGLIAFGVAEVQKCASERVSVGVVTEAFERTLRRVAVSGIQPSVFNLGILRLGGEDVTALIVQVPPSTDVPHLIYRNEYFGAPIRNNADTEWMRERQLESLYRFRLDQRRRAGEDLARTYAELAVGRDTANRAWLIAVARPRVPAQNRRLTRKNAQQLIRAGGELSLVWVSRSAVHPLGNVNSDNPRVGLRRWTAPNAVTTNMSGGGESWVSIHDDGTVTVAAAAGAHRIRDGYAGGNRIAAGFLEAGVSDLMGLLRRASEAIGTGDYEVQIGIEWAGSEPIWIESVDQFGHPDESQSIPLAAYAPVAASIRVDVDSEAFHDQVHELALDVINQGGVQNLRFFSA